MEIKGFIFCLILIFNIQLGCDVNKSSHTFVDQSTADPAKTGRSSIVQELRDNDHLTIKERIALYNRLKRESPNRYNFENEDELTMYGYSFLWEEKVSEAIEIFKLIVAEFPNSSNAYDSLGEAYLKNGNKDAALANYQKSFELNPENFNAEDQIELILHPERIPEKPAQKFARVFTTEEYLSDLDQLGRKLIEVHPNALKFISKEEFWQLIERKKEQITARTTYGQFAWYCSEIIASINCSHTSMGSFDVENEMLPLTLRFPLQTRWVDDQLFVIDPLNNKTSVKVKDEILSINGVMVTKLMKDIYRHIPSQGYIETTKKHFFNTWSTGMISFALGFPEIYEVVIKGKDSALILETAKSFRDPLYDPSIKYCDDQLCLEFIDDGENAIMTIASFNYYRWNNFNVYEDFIDQSFKELAEKGVKNLIIDLRFNGGGSQSASIHLLRYLVDKPFTYYSTVEFEGKSEESEGEEVLEPFENTFAGKLYFIIDGIGNSTTGHFMSIVKVLDLGTIVGEELGSNQFCSAGQTICRLKHTKLLYYVANNTHESMAIQLPDERGILPDHYVTQSIAEYLDSIDTVKEYTIKLLEN